MSTAEQINISMIFRHLVRHPGLPSTPKYAHRNGSMVQIFFSQIYGTRAKLWQQTYFNLIIAWNYVASVYVAFKLLCFELSPPYKNWYIWVYIWLYMAIYGYIWLYMAIYGYIWLYMAIYGYIRLYMAIYMIIYGYICLYIVF